MTWSEGCKGVSRLKEAATEPEGYKWWGVQEEDVMHRREGQWERPATAMPCPAKVQHNQKSPGPNSGMQGQIGTVS